MKPGDLVHLVRRTDGSEIGGDYSFMVASGPKDWDAAESDAEGWDGPVDYDLVTLVVQGVETRTYPLCSNPGCETVATHWGLCEPHARLDDPEHFADVAKIEESLP